MMRKIFMIVLLLLAYCSVAFAGVQVEAIYPYNLNRKGIHTVEGRSTIPLYIDVLAYDMPQEQQAEVQVEVPEGFAAQPSKGWELAQEGRRAIWRCGLRADYGRNFSLLYIQPQDNTISGEKQLKVVVKGANWTEHKSVAFTYKAEGETVDERNKRKKVDKQKFSWYIQSVTIPVDRYGVRDDRAAAGVVYVRDIALEGFRSRINGEGATNWAAVYAHPACHLLLDMRNPQQDVKLLRFRAELVDKKTGEVVPGLSAVGKVNEENEQGFAGSTNEEKASTALVSLDGSKAQTFVIPVYVDFFNVLSGDYSLRVTVSDNKQMKVTEVPVTMAKKHSLDLLAVGFAIAAFVLVVLFSGKLKDCIFNVGAKGAISISLFAAIAFGGITLPTTILGDILHVFLGPFSGLFTGILNGVLQYLLIMSLLMLFRKPGVVALMYVIRFILNGMMFGHFTPLGVLSYSVNIVVLEATLYFLGFYKKEELTSSYMLMIALAMGVADACITFINLEQMMFFYRLYYADWYLALYMIINGFLYSSLGAWFGYKTGGKLRQVMGE